MPRIVEDYIIKVNFLGTKKAYFVLTCGTHTLNAVHYVQTLCRKKGLELLGFDEILMPENYIALFTAPNKEESDAIIAKAETKVTQLAMDIRDKVTLPGFKKTGSIKGQISSSIMNPVCYKLVFHADGFHSTEKCIHCEKCAKLCPLNNIDMVEGTPVWREKCTHCMACICGCPKEAIEYKKQTQGKTRYYLSV
jgi:ferredoxin